MLKACYGIVLTAHYIMASVVQVVFTEQGFSKLEEIIAKAVTTLRRIVEAQESFSGPVGHVHPIAR